MVFERPLFLLIIPFLWALLWLGGRHSLARWGKRKKYAAVSLRGLILLLLSCALAGPLYLIPTREPAIVFLRDVSAGIAPQAAQQAKTFVSDTSRGHSRDSADIVFAAEPAVVRPFGGSESRLPDELPVDATDLASALDFASALLPVDRPGRIVLFSDGISNRGPSPLVALPGLMEGHIEVDVVPLERDRSPDAAVTAIQLPPSLREGQVFDLPVDVVATQAFPSASVRLYQNGLLIASMDQPLSPGANHLMFHRIRAEGGMASYEVLVEAMDDVRPRNDRLKTTAIHGGAARTLIIDRVPSHSEALSSALREEGFSVEVRPPAGLPASLAEFDRFDLIMLADAPAADFQNEQLQNFSAWVKSLGGGFVMIGGEDSFGAGGYFRTPVAALLPVRIERDEREETPVVALLVILDRSGSMAASAGDKTKMALADEGAAYALDILQRRDFFGLFAVDTVVHEVLSLDHVTDKAAAARKIAGITAGGGGIYIYTSLAEALPRMRDIDAKLKHIILFADASDAEEKFSDVGGSGGVPVGGRSALDLASALFSSRVTLSVVALGTQSDKDAAFLRDLAARGGGRFYLTADALSLPRLFAQETTRATQSSLREDAFLVRPAAPADVLAGIAWKEAPPLLGLNVGVPKPGAEVFLETEGGEPIFVTWRQGLGQVAAFLSDAGDRWASEWLTWPGYAKFWTQVARRLVRPDVRTDLSVSLRETDAKLIIEADAISSEGSFRNGLPVHVTVAGQQGGSVSVPATQIAPGLYRAELPKPASDLAIIAVDDGSERPVSLAWTRQPSREFFPDGDGMPILEKIARDTGGMVNPAPDQIFRLAPFPVTARRDISGWFLACALLLWPFDIWIRRREGK